MTTSQSPNNSVDERCLLYRKYWTHHLWVYRQLLVWITRVLTLQDRNVLYLVAVYSAANAVVMLLTAMGLSPMLLLGLFFLTLSATHIFCVISNASTCLRLLSGWTEKESELFNKLCHRVAQYHVGLLRMVNLILNYRETDPKKFYGVGIISTMLLSNVGLLINDWVLFHVLVNFILLVPLILHYKLHTHLAKRNWKEIGLILKQVATTLLADLSAFEKHFRRHQSPQRPSGSDPSEGAQPVPAMLVLA